MSSIGPGSIGSMNIAGSFAGAQRTEANNDSTKAQSAAKNFQIDQKAMSAHGQNDVVEAELSSDRDADGRQSYGEPGEQHSPGQESESQSLNRPRTPDLDGERGLSLDLDA